MKGNIYLVVLPAIFLLSSLYYLGISGRNIRIMGSAPWERAIFEVRAKNKLLRRWKNWLNNQGMPLYEQKINRDEYTLREKMVVFKEGNILLLGKAIYVKGNVPLSLFPDLLLENFPSSREILHWVFGDLRIQPLSPPFYIIEGKNKGVYVKGNVIIGGSGNEIEVSSGGKQLRTNTGFLVIDGSCKITGSFNLTLICAGKIYGNAIDPSSKLIFISAEQGFFEPATTESEVVIRNTIHLMGEIMAKRVVLEGKGTFEGGIQAMEVEGLWKHKRKGMEIQYYPRMLFQEETLAWAENRIVEVE